MSRHHADRPAIPDDNTPVAPAHQPTWWTVRTVRHIAFACVGLAVALSLVSTLVSWRSAEAANERAVEVEQRLTALEEYVQGRGEYRDREAERLQREIRDSICDVLDQFPPSPLLDVPRAKYECGPGTPLASSTAPAGNERPSTAPSAGSAAGATPTRPAPAATLQQKPVEPGQPDGGPAAPTSGPAPDLPSPVPTPAPPGPPLVNLRPLTDPVCLLLAVCL